MFFGADVSALRLSRPSEHMLCSRCLCCNVLNVCFENKIHTIQYKKWSVQFRENICETLSNTCCKFLMVELWITESERLILYKGETLSRNHTHTRDHDDIIVLYTAILILLARIYQEIMTHLLLLYGWFSTISGDK